MNDHRETPNSPRLETSMTTANEEANLRRLALEKYEADTKLMLAAPALADALEWILGVELPDGTAADVARAALRLAGRL